MYSEVGVFGTTGDAIKLLKENRIPNYPLPERAVVALSSLVRYKRILQKR
ncbi:MAG: hypothetical protein J7J06_06970 [Methanosarcinales archaeon]|nr:hypothetical protein [Methanosarcinales archaeon]